MEGAAFMYSCLVRGVDFAQVRAVSNAVERRNRSAWNIPGAIEALTAAARQILEQA
jgi:futalosine hydrolase